MMENKPMVSVIMITYGHQNYILEAIKGILIQEYNGLIELIIANDNSPDETDDIVKNLITNTVLPPNIQIKYTRHDTNKGMMGNFVWAVKQANGKYLALCEGDDYWMDPLKLQKQVDFLENNRNYFACQHWRTVLSSDGLHKEEKIQSHIFTQCVVFRNELDQDLLTAFATRNILNADRLLEYYCKAKGKYEYMDFNGAVYRYSGDGVYSSLNLVDQRLKGLHSFTQILDFIENSNYTYKDSVAATVKTKVVKFYYYLIGHDGFTKWTYLNKMLQYKTFGREQLSYLKSAFMGVKEIK